MHAGMRFQSEFARERGKVHFGDGRNPLRTTLRNFPLDGGEGVVEIAKAIPVNNNVSQTKHHPPIPHALYTSSSFPPPLLLI